MNFDAEWPDEFEAAAKKLYYYTATEDETHTWPLWGLASPDMRIVFRRKVVEQRLLAALMPFVGKPITADTHTEIVNAMLPFLGQDPTSMNGGSR